MSASELNQAEVWAKRVLSHSDPSTRLVPAAFQTNSSLDGHNDGHEDGHGDVHDKISIRVEQAVRESVPKHVLQRASMIAHMQHYGLLQKSYAFAAFGEGKVSFFSSFIA